MSDDSAAAAPSPTTTPPAVSGSSLDFDSLTDDSEKYSTPGQQVGAVAEGALRGLISAPVASAIETYVGVPKEDILGRQKTNSVLAGAGEASTLIGGALFGTGEAAVLSKLGEAAVGAANLGGAEGIAKIGSQVLQQATEMAAYQGGDEVSKMILNDPDTSAQTAMSNIGLGAAVGGITGAALGSLSPLWKATVGNKIAPLLEDMKGRFNFRLQNPDMVSAVGTELQDLHSNMSDTIEKLYSDSPEGGGIRAEQIAKSMPEVSDANTAKINDQVQKVSDTVSSALEDMQNNVKVKGKVPYLAQDLQQFQEVVTNPQASYADKFNALDDLKKTMQGYSKYGSDVQDTEFGAIAKKLGAQIRPALEDSKVWGAAGDIQAKVNEAISEFLPTQKDIISKFSSKIAGERVIDSSKVGTYINQLGKPSAEIKQQMMENYLNSSDKLISNINDIFTRQGLEAPIKNTSTAMLRDTIGEKTAGAKIVDNLIDKELSGILGKTAGGAIGATAGSLFGNGAIGALIGEHALGPFLSSVMPGLNKPLLENPSSVQGLKSAIDYGMSVAKGEKALNKSVAGVFKAGGQVLASSQIPSEASKSSLDKVVSMMQDKPMKVAQVDNGKLGHYLPNHQSALTQASVQSLQYLQQLKPQPWQPTPLDKPIQPTQAQEARYERALEIAQSPSVVLQHIKDGTLQASDIQDIHAMYPALYTSMVQKLSNQMTSKQADEEHIPYKTRVGISLFLGQPLDSTMNPQSIIAAQPKPVAPSGQQQQPGGNKGKPKSKTSLTKMSNSYKTPSQAAESDRANRD
jgi:hypothetical protein